MKRFVLSFLLFSFFIAPVSAQCGSRYTDSSFTVTHYRDLQYGSNYNSNNELTKLLLDVYEPDNDTSSVRPLIIFVHGGSFIGGSRMDQRIDQTARKFAEKGYVTANIEYRVEQTILITPFLNFASQDNWYKAMIRAAQDLKAAIRYFKKDAATNGNTYKIDTSRIILYGSSAGAITALNTVFIDDTSDMTAPFKRNIAALGGWDGNSGNPGYDLKGIKAIVSCSGAFDNVNALSNNTDIAYLGFHNNPDLTVPFDAGCFTTVFCHLGTFYGGNRIIQKARSLNMKAAFYPFNFLNHPVDSYSDVATHTTIINQMTTFLADVVCNDRITSIRNHTLVKNMAVYPNPSNGSFRIELPENKFIPKARIKIYSVTGVEVYHSVAAIPSDLTLKQELANGMYFIEIQSDNPDNNMIYQGKVIIRHE